MAKENTTDTAIQQLMPVTDCTKIVLSLTDNERDDIDNIMLTLHRLVRLRRMDTTSNLHAKVLSLGLGQGAQSTLEQAILANMDVTSTLEQLVIFAHLAEKRRRDIREVMAMM